MIIKNKKFIKFLLSMMIIFPQFGSVFAAKNVNLADNLLPKKQVVENKSKFPLQEAKNNVTSLPSKEIRLKNGVSKKEKIYIIKDEYSGDLAKNPNKYTTMRIEVSYYADGVLLGVSYAENNFRYNPITKEAKCLSSSTYQVCLNKKVNLETFARRENETFSLGRGYASIEFSFGSVNDTCDYNFTCDSSGEISQIFNK